MTTTSRAVCPNRISMINLFGVKLHWPFPIAYGLSSSSAMVLGVPVFGSNASWFIKKAHSFFRRIEKAKYWFLYRFHPDHKYHLIDTKLGYGYHERDDQLLYGAIACLIGYVEDCELTGCHDPGDEARAIMHWWNVQRPADQKQHDAWFHELNSGKKLQTKPVEGPSLGLVEIVFEKESEDREAKRRAIWDLEHKMRKDEQRFLHRLIDIRPGMWT